MTDAKRPSHKEDEKLIARAQRGDQVAFGDLYEAYLAQIYRYIYFRVRNHKDVEDLTEQVFIKAWRAIGNYQIQGTPFLAWLYRIAHNVVVDFHRGNKVEIVDIDTQYDLPAVGLDPEAQLIKKNTLERVATAIQALSPSHQQVLTLRLLLGLSHNETADIMERSAGAVRVMQHRALQALRKMLDEA